MMRGFSCLTLAFSILTGSLWASDESGQLTVLGKYAQCLRRLRGYADMNAEVLRGDVIVIRTYLRGAAGILVVHPPTSIDFYAFPRNREEPRFGSRGIRLRLSNGQHLLFSEQTFRGSFILQEFDVGPYNLGMRRTAQGSWSDGPRTTFSEPMLELDHFMALPADDPAALEILRDLSLNAIRSVPQAYRTYRQLEPKRRASDPEPLFNAGHFTGALPSCAFIDRAEVRKALFETVMSEGDAQ